MKRPSRCTSFAIQAAQIIEGFQILREVPVESRFEFEFYDVEGHRLARCKKTGLAIDSTSRKGPVVVPTGGVYAMSTSSILDIPNCVTSPDALVSRRLNRNGKQIEVISIASKSVVLD